MEKIKKYFTTGDVARYCEVDVNTVKNWIRRGNLQAFTTPSGHYRILRDRFIEFITDQGFPYDREYFGVDPEAPDILVIDDDSAHRDLIVYLLREIYGDVKLDTAINGFDGYTKLFRHRPRMIILDLLMPEMAGLDFLRNIQFNNELNGIKVLVISSYLDNKTIEELEKLQVDAMISKPVAKNELRARCDELLGRTDGARYSR